MLLRRPTNWFRHSAASFVCCSSCFWGLLFSLGPFHSFLPFPRVSIFIFVHFCVVCRGLLESVDAQAAAAASSADSVSGRPAQHHVPDVRLSEPVRNGLLPQQRHVFHHQSRRIHRVQLPVSRAVPVFLGFGPSAVHPVRRAPAPIRSAEKRVFELLMLATPRIPFV